MERSTKGTHCLISRVKKTIGKNSAVKIKDRCRINTTEEKFKKQIKITNWFLTKLQTQFQGERTVFSTDGAQTIGCLYTKNWTSIYTFHLKCIIDLNVKSETIKLLGKKVNPLWTWIRQRFLRYDINSMIHNKIVSWASSKKISLQMTLLKNKKLRTRRIGGSLGELCECLTTVPCSCNRWGIVCEL